MVISEIVVGALIAVIVLALTLRFIAAFLTICKPSEVVILSGRKHRLPDGSMVGYTVLRGGRGLRIPIIEQVNRMDVRLIPVMVEVHNAYSKGGIPLSVQAIANIKVSTDPGLVRNAIERSLGMSTAQIGAVGQQTLEGVLREVVAELTPEEVNEDRLKFAEILMKHAKDDFDKLGLVLDVLKVQSVSDDQGYLNNLGRARIANMVRDAKNAESEAKQAIEEAQARARQRAESARKQAEAAMLTKQNEVRAELAKLEAEAKAVENEALVAAETARAEAEQELQAERAVLERLRLECDVFLPAEAARLAAEADARAQAAPLIESGKAAAQALELVAAEWQASGRSGRDLYLLQHLEGLITASVQRVEQAQIGELAVADGGDGAGFASTVASFPVAVGAVLRQTGRAVGLDLDGLLDGSAPAGKTEAGR